MVLDIDTKDNGHRSLDIIQDEHGKLPDTVQAVTGGGGDHYFFKYESDVVGRIGYRNGIDIKSDGGYVIVYPSVHVSGQTYEWYAEQSPTKKALAVAPVWMKERKQALATPIPDVIPEGKRDATLVSLAGSMRRRGASENSILLAITSENNVRCKPPLPDEQLQKIAKSVGRYEPEAIPVAPAPEEHFWGWEEYIEKAQEDIRETTLDTICKYHIPFLDDALLGIFKSELVIIGADTGVGKTQIANDLAYHNAALKKHVYLFSLEGDKFEVGKREWYKRTVKLCMDDGRVDLNLSYRAFVTNMEPEMWKYRDAAKHDLIEDYKKYIHVYKRLKPLDVDLLTEQLEKSSGDASLAVIDHLHYFEFMSANEYSEITELLKKIRELLTTCRIPVVLISHLRKKDKTRMLPTNDDFHGSSNIPKQADTCIMLSKMQASFENDKEGESEFLADQIRRGVYPTAVQVTKSRHERPSSVVGVMDYDLNTRRYSETYKLYAVGQYSLLELDVENYPSWARKEVNVCDFTRRIDG